jgi:hypothetical protein
MGLFSSKKKITITVATQAIRVAKDSQLPDSFLKGTAESLANETGLVENVENNLVTGIGLKGHHFHARAKKQYAYGIPAGKLLVMNRATPSVINSIAAEKRVKASDIIIEYSYYMPKNLYHLAWQDLVKDHGYDATTNKLGKLSAELKQDVYLDDLILYVQYQEFPEYDPVVFEAWGRPIQSAYSPSRPYSVNSALYAETTEAHASPILAKAQFTVKYSYNRIIDPNVNAIETPGLISSSFTLSAQIQEIEDQIDTEKGEETNLKGHLDYYQVKFRIGGKTEFITRDASYVAGTESTAVFTEPKKATGEFFPMVYFRHDKKDLTVNENAQEYKDSVALLKTIGMDYKDMGKSIHYERVEKEIDTTETFIDDDPASKTYGEKITRKKKVPVLDANGEEQFKPRKDDKGNDQLADIKSVILIFAVPVNPKGKMKEVELKYLFDFFSLWATDPGNLDPSQLFMKIGNNLGRNTTRTIENYNSIHIEDKVFKMSLQNQGIVVTHRFDTVKPAENVRYTMKVVGNVHTYTFHNTDLTAIDVSVTGLKMVYHVGSGATAGYTDVADGEKNKERNHLLIPIDKSITENYSLRDRELLYSKGQHLLYNTEKITVTKIPWYSTGFFKIFVMIIMIIIVVLIAIFAPYLLPAAIKGVIAYGITAATVTALAIFMVKMIVVAVILHFVLKAVAKLIGPEAAAILGLVIMVASIGYGIAAGLSATPAAASALMANASALMTVATGLISAAANETQSLINDTYKDYELFLKSTIEQDKALEDAQALLENNGNIIMEPFMILGEDPEQYYNRIAHSSNPGTACFDLLSNFCDILLTLPTINDTIKQES